ncbi:unnamed protein product, partial [Amoebophrya sp. A25]
SRDDKVVLDGKDEDKKDEDHVEKNGTSTSPALPLCATLDEKVNRVRTAILHDVFGLEHQGKMSNAFFVLEQHAFSQGRFRVVFGVDRASLPMGKLFAWCW